MEIGLTVDFGRGVPLDGIEFRLPPDSPDTVRTLSNAGVDAGPGPDLRVGTPRWADRGYVGTLYPRGTRPGGFLRAYSDALSTVELNATWYRCEPEQIRRWAEQVDAGFRFCPKLPGHVGHEKRLRGVQRDVELFLAAVAEFGPKLGVCWLLLPNDFGPREFDELRRFVENWPREIPLAVEMRHAQWFAERRTRDEVFALFRDHGTIAVMTDVAGRRDVLHMELTTPIAFVRLALNDLDPTDEERTEAWADRLATWFELGLRTAYFFVHQPTETNNVALVRHLLNTFNLRTGAALAVPATHGAIQGRLF